MRCNHQSEDNVRSLGRLFNHITRNIQQIVRRQLEDSGIGPGQYLYLHILSREEGITQYELTEKIGTDKATTAKAAAQLEKLGYIQRQQDTADRRQMRLFLTDKGRAFLPRLRHILRGITEICSADLSREVTDELFRLLKTMAASTGKRLDELKRTKE